MINVKNTHLETDLEIEQKLSRKMTRGTGRLSRENYSKSNPLKKA